MTINRFLMAVAIAVSAIGADVYAQTTEVESLFEYPQVPDKLTKINLRSNYMIEHLWEKCKLEKDIDNVASFRKTFVDYLSFFILADIDEVDKSIKNFVDRVAKNPKNLQSVLGFVDAEVFQPTAQYCSDDVYEMFSRHLIANKNVDKSVKGQLKVNAEKVKNSRVGTAFGNAELTLDGSPAGDLYSLKSQYTVVIMNIDGDVDTSIYRLRLSTDIATNNVIKSGAVAVVSMYSLRTKNTDGNPSNWYSATVSNMEDLYDMRIKPVVYVLDKDKKIVAKSPGIVPLLTMMAQLGNTLGV